MTRWEYYSEWFHEPPTSAELDPGGKAGWELAAVTYYSQDEEWHCIFKRPLPFPWWRLLIGALKGPFA